MKTPSIDCAVTPNIFFGESPALLVAAGEQEDFRLFFRSRPPGRCYQEELADYCWGILLWRLTNYDVVDTFEDKPAVAGTLGIEPLVCFGRQAKHVDRNEISSAKTPTCAIPYVASRSANTAQ
jgi:hypothetical protein